MKNLLEIYAIFSAILGSSIYIAQKKAVKLPEIINFYVNDFLIIPIVLTISLYVLRWSKNDKKYQLPLWIILYCSGLYAVIFEYFLPKTHPRYTADSVDVFLYFLSGFLFFMLQKIDENNLKKNN
ncbi:hypothetical protein [Tenacibaculum piscium]|uniref:Magnesium citrate secondary transporter n=1 Tax=Tenacibaculum piscium TaxID=1458515 RepID=A0A2H1YEY2_9FLAO|nr:hypothetical protein [Tenacibaculum piscium]MBE7628873.1 hypothetical protein [Tenacibaculum piscium]MBE7671176.1 hypothetical protein [Tenacibaculum piscium]MBE7685106.1 hypothetical protein [Tenacibaculum piscium]MBE7689809.1 hypothetical protein [Tenacibaculum piscium]SOS74033.1 conserved membrane hypothetical protein [Tenacibaculum piscium]